MASDLKNTISLNVCTKHVQKAEIVHGFLNLPFLAPLLLYYKRIIIVNALLSRFSDNAIFPGVFPTDIQGIFFSGGMLDQFLLNKRRLSQESEQ